MFIFSLNRSSQPDPSLLHFQEAQHPAATPMFSQSPAPCPAQLSLSSRQMNGAVCLSALPCAWKALLQEAPSSTPACPARSAFGSLDLQLEEWTLCPSPSTKPPEYVPGRNLVPCLVPLSPNLPGSSKTEPLLCTPISLIENTWMSLSAASRPGNKHLTPMLHIPDKITLMPLKIPPPHRSGSYIIY